MSAPYDGSSQAAQSLSWSCLGSASRSRRGLREGLRSDGPNSCPSCFGEFSAIAGGGLPKGGKGSEARGPGGSAAGQGLLAETSGAIWRLSASERRSSAPGPPLVCGAPVGAGADCFSHPAPRCDARSLLKLAIPGNSPSLCLITRFLCTSSLCP